MMGEPKAGCPFAGSYSRRCNKNCICVPAARYAPRLRGIARAAPADVAVRWRRTVPCCRVIQEGESKNWFLVQIALIRNGLFSDLEIGEGL